jgi:hypothetical protein
MGQSIMGLLDQAVIPVKRKSMKQFIKKIFGIDKIEQITSDAELRMQESVEEAAKHAREAEAARQAAIVAKEEERIAKLSPKELATEKKEPWVSVVETHVNADNPRNGFFDLDWNEFFVLQLKEAGYNGPSEEAIVDAWFQDLCRNVGAEEGVSMERRGSGFINVKPLQNGKSEIS